MKSKNFFHLHMLSDATGETLIAVGRAVAAQYGSSRSIEHVYPLVRSRTQLEAALNEIDREPGIVLYTLVDERLAGFMLKKCEEIGVPAIDVLKPMNAVFETYLGERSSGRMGAQHTMDESYFQRMEALNFTMAHDDGNLPYDMETADVILIGISRTSKTPTSIYLAQRGVKTANVPLVPGADLAPEIITAKKPLVVALVASAERILQVRENRLLTFNRDLTGDTYIDRAAIAEELAWCRRLCKKHDWPMIDVSRRSVEETAAAILALRSSAA